MDKLIIQRQIATDLKPETQLLFNNFHVKTFGYRKFSEDGSSSGFSNNDHWNTIYIDRFENKVIDTYQNEFNELKNSSINYFVRSGIPNMKSEYSKALFANDIWNSIVIYIRSKKFIEGFYFAQHRHNNIFSFTREDVDLLSKFSLYLQLKIKLIFNDRLYKSLSSKTYNPIILRKFFRTCESQDLAPPLNNGIDGYECNSALTQREGECISLLLEGMTMKRIALNLMISPRTVEQHLRNIRVRLNLSSKSQLIDFFKKNLSALSNIV